jgi:hypothetical protein
MKARVFGYALSIGAAAALLAGCGGAQPAILAPGAAPVNLALAPSRSSMSPDAARQDLLYVSDDGTHDVYAFGYRSGKLLGTLTGFKIPGGECVDHKGDVFITDSLRDLTLEYAHGGTAPIRALTGIPSPMDCAVDRLTGDLAVTYQNGVAVYRHGLGAPQLHNLCAATCLDYQDGISATYDDNSNLFILYAYAASSGVALVLGLSEVVGNRFHEIWGGDCECLIGGLQWDGQYLAVGDDDEVIFRITETGQEVGEVQLPGVLSFSFWIKGSTLVIPDDIGGGNGEVQFYDYPSGNLIRTITGLNSPAGVAVSRARR